MACKTIGTWLAVIAMIAVSSTVIDAASHMVGGSSGWTIPPNTTFYSDWASSQSFAVGDTLVFNFTTGQHNVIEVPKSGYDACSAKNQVGASLTTGPATVTIKSPGTHYFICGVPGHCSIGQKLMISVGSAAPAPAPTASGTTPTAAPAPAPAASGTTPTPTAAPAPAPAASGTTPTPTAAPAPAPAASGTTPTAAPAPAPTASGTTPTVAPTPAPTTSLAPSGDGGKNIAPAAPVVPSTTGPSSSTGGSIAQPPNSAAPSSSISSGFLAIAALFAGTWAFLL